MVVNCEQMDQRTIATKTAFAAARGVKPACVSNWIRRGIVTKAAIVGEGPRARIWIERAEADLALRRDPAKPPPPPPPRSANGSSADPMPPRRDDTAAAPSRALDDEDLRRRRKAMPTGPSKMRLPPAAATQSTRAGGSIGLKRHGCGRTSSAGSCPPGIAFSRSEDRVRSLDSWPPAAI
jgi:hypothetical protein